MDKLFQIGDFCFRLLCPENLTLPPNFLLFETGQGIPEYTFRIRIADNVLPMEGKVIVRRPDLIVCKTFSGERRLIGVKGRDTFYACYQEMSDQQAEIYLSVQELSKLHIDPVFTSLFALERHMIKRENLILHCAYVEHQRKAILFSAPSGTGKSTQAELWKRYRGSRIINGDRALLRKSRDIWSVCGWPVCGSSDICELGNTPIHGIVMLRQGTRNHVERLSPVWAFTQLYAQVTINQWNRTFVQHAMELVEDLVKQVPVYQLTCDMTENAVRCLEGVLFPASVTNNND